jgi:hypothetical protein
MIKDKRISLYDAGGATDLLCPRCGADYLHHTDVTAFDRGEDAETLVRTKLSGETVTRERIDSSAAGNPSLRRDGIAVRFWCESCCPQESSDIIELTIAQHKGQTEIGWRYTPRI